MKKLYAITAALALLGMSIAVQAAITIDTVTVGDPGNAADTRWAEDALSGYGKVDYTYNIGKYEATASQYCTFLNAVAKTDTYGLYHESMAIMNYGSGISRSGSSGSYSYTVDSAFVNRPVNYVSFWDACRFANWLNNGQMSGVQDATTTEDGAYCLNGYTGDDGRTIQRKAGCQWAIANEDEWYKAAYYKGGSINAGYWLYPTQSDAAPGRDMADPSGNNANFCNDWSYTLEWSIDNGKCTTVAGQFKSSASAYGTFDQGGNLWEWNEAVPHIYGDVAARYLRGGSFSVNSYFLKSGDRNSDRPTYGDYDYGFRVVQVVPEPSSILALLCGLGGMTGLVVRKAKK